MRRPAPRDTLLDLVAEQHGVTRAPAATLVQRFALPDRPLLRIGPDAPVWSRGFALPGKDPVDPEAGSIVWVKPPPDAKPEVLGALVLRMRECGAHVKVLAPDRVEDVATQEWNERAPELAAEQSREVVYQLCRELADRAGIPREQVIEQVEPYLAGAGL